MKPRPVHTMLLGDQNACAKRLPFAQAQIQALFTSIGDSARTAVRHFEIDGDRVDLTADRLGGRIVITARALGQLREYGSVFNTWQLLVRKDGTNITDQAVLLADMGAVTATFPADASTAQGFLSQENLTGTGRVAMHGPTGARLWTFSGIQVPPATLPGNVGHFSARGLCLVAGAAVLADGWASQSQVIYASYPFDLSIIGYQLDPATLQFTLFDSATGDVLLTAPTKTATIWGADEPVFVPSKIAGGTPLFETFHAIGTVMMEGTDEEDARLVVSHYELQHVGTDLTVLADETLAETPVDVVVDETGTVYVRYDGVSTARFEAYTRDLTRDSAKDFIDVPLADLTFDADLQRTTVIVGDTLYSRTDLWRLKAFSRTGALTADHAIHLEFPNTNTALVQLRA